jgi:hypothetical protein
MHQHNAKHCLDALTLHDRRLGTNLRYSLAFVRRMEEQFENTKGAIRIRKSKMDRTKITIQHIFVSGM